MSTEAPNSLRSRSKYKVIDLVSEGDIEGLVNGQQSVYFNETPIIASNGSTRNFENSTVVPLRGENNEMRSIQGKASTKNADLAIISKNADLSNSLNTEVTASVGTIITKDNPEGSGSGDGSYTFTINEANADACRIGMRVNSLYEQNTDNGDMYGAKVEFSVQVAGTKNGILQDYVPASAVMKGSATSKEQYWQSFSGTSPVNASQCAFTVRLNNVRASTKSYKKYTARVAVQSSSDGTNWTTAGYKDYSAYYNPWGSRYYSEVGTGMSYKGEISSLRIDVGGSVGGKRFRVGWIDGNGNFSSSFAIRSGESSGTPASLTLTKQEYFAGGNYVINGKCVSVYDMDICFNLPKDDSGLGAPWSVKVSRITGDHTTSNFSDKLYLSTYTVIESSKFYYPYVDGFVLDLDAEDFSGNIPSRAYEIYGKKIKVPSNYDGVGNYSSEVWDGTFHTVYSDNPAWVLYDMITNKRFGLGDKIDASQVDKWALYTIGRYCDGLVPAFGDNGYERRYTCNCCINSQSDALDLLQTMASAFRGMVYWGEGTIVPTSDMPTSPVLNVGPANVINGSFSYSSPAINTIHTVAYVTWNDPANDYKQAVEVYEDPEAIEKYGYNVANVNAFGCTSKTLARRLGAWAVRTEVDVPDTVTYEASFDHGFVRPGDIINISDPAYTQEELLGRIVSVTNNGSSLTIKLDRQVKRIGGEDSNLSLYLPNGTIVEPDCSVSSDTTSDTITVSSSGISPLPVAGSVWMLKKESVQPRQWRIISITESQKNIFKITATLFDPNKNAEIESNAKFETISYTAIPEGDLPAPSALSVSEFLSKIGTAISSNAIFSWNMSPDPRAMYYRAQYKKSNSTTWKACEPNITTISSIDIIGIEPGTYDFRVRATDSSGLIVSDWTVTTGVTLLGKNKPPENVSNLTATVIEDKIKIEWSPVSDIDIAGYELRYGSSWESGTRITTLNANSYIWSTFPYQTQFKIWIKAKDTSGNYSVSASSVEVMIEDLETPTITGSSYLRCVEVTASVQNMSINYKSFEIWRSAVESSVGEMIASVACGNGSATHLDSTIPTYEDDYYYRARLVDKWGNHSEYSEQITLNCMKIQVQDITADWIMSNTFETARGVGPEVDGVKFTADGMQGWKNHINMFNLNALGASKISGWTIGYDRLYSDNIELGINGLRGQNETGTVFDLNMNGNAKIGGWRVDANGIYNGKIRLLSNGNIETSDYVSDASGWAIKGNGDAEFNNVKVRGKVKTAVFEKDEISVVGGEVLVRPASVTSRNGMGEFATTTVSLAPQETFEMIVQYLGVETVNTMISDTMVAELNNLLDTDYEFSGFESDVTWNEYYTAENSALQNFLDNGMISVEETENLYVFVEDTSLFSVGDVIRIKDGIDYDQWLVVTGKTDIQQEGYGPALIVDMQRPDTDVFTDYKKGLAVVNYGASGSGGILLDGNAPKIDIYTHDGHPEGSTGIKVHGRLGNLNGINGISTDRQGIFFGNPDSSAQNQHYIQYTKDDGKLKIQGEVEITSGATYEKIMAVGSKAVQLWYQDTQNLSQYPAKPTSKVTQYVDVTNEWTKAKPYIRSNGVYYYCFQYEANDDTATWSAVTRDSTDTRLAMWAASGDTTYIDGGKIYTGSVTADQIASHTITSENLAVNSILAENINVTAMKKPDGPCLRLSAKGCTTASIRQTTDSSGNPVYGVKDVSGYNHHGQAPNGVSIVDDTKMGKVFSFGQTSGQGLTGFTNIPITKSGMTYRVCVSNVTAKGTTGWPQIFRHLNGNIGIIIQITKTILSMIFYNSSGSAVWTISKSVNLAQNQWYDVCFTIDETEGAAIYLDGLLVASNANYTIPEDVLTNTLTINHNFTWDYKLADIRIYPRALSATEVKSMYMLPDEAIFGQLNADLIGANVINASNLVKTQALITESAQIGNAIITDAKISGKISANHIDASSITISSLNGYSTMNSAISTAQTTANNAQTAANNANTNANNSEKLYSYTVNLSASSYNQNLYYPVAFTLSNGIPFNQIRCSVQLNSGTKPSWSTHPNGFTTVVTAMYKASGWGTTDGLQYVTENHYQYCDKQPVFAMTQCSYNSRAIFFCRGGGKYFFKTSNNSTPEIYTATGSQVYNSGDYHWYVSPVATPPTTAVANQNSSTQLKLFREYYPVVWCSEGKTTINGGQITAETVSANQIAANAITSAKIATSAIKSRNWVAGQDETGTNFTTGTFLNLQTGTINSPNMCVNASRAKFKGEVTATSGSFTGTVTATGGKIGMLTIGSDGSFAYSGTKTDTTKSYLKFQDSTDSNEINSFHINLKHSTTNETIIQPSTIQMHESSGNKAIQLSTYGTGLSDMDSLILCLGRNTSRYGAYIQGKLKVNSTDYTSDIRTKKDFRTVSVLNKLKMLSVCSWRFDEEKLIEQCNHKIDASNQRIEEENIIADAENARIEEENEVRAKQGLDLLPFKRRRQGRPHLTADKSVVHNRNIGCMAQEFNEAFKTNKGAEDCLNVTDVVGVCMRAIQELAERNDELIREVRQMKRILRSANILTDQIIAEDRDNEAIRRLEIAKARQAKREEQQDENTDSDTDTDISDGLC